MLPGSSGPRRGQTDVARRAISREGPADMPPSIPGLAAEPAIMLDERTRPDFRAVFGNLARSSTDIAVAVTRVRLSTLDLTPSELEAVGSMRVLLTELNALTLDAEARLIRADPNRAWRVQLFRSMLEEGRLEIRSAPLGGWSPDFTVFSDGNGPQALLTGFHWFERPYPHRGPALASLHFGDAARTGARRHLEVWEKAHDVGPAVWSILSKAERVVRIRGLVTG